MQEFLWRASGTAVGLAAAVAVAGSVNAGIILDPGTYPLANHPFGNQIPPEYGLRLDELIDVTESNDIFTFDFDDKRSNMFLEWDGTSIRIFGEAFGGLDRGDDYDPDFRGVAMIDFTYSLVETKDDDDDLVVTTPDFTNSGTITLWNGDVVNLYDEQNKKGYTFRLGDEDDDQGHRGFPGISGWGWLTYHNDGTDSPGAQDWLFTVVPTPAAGALFGLAALIGPRRRRA